MDISFSASGTLALILAASKCDSKSSIILFFLLSSSSLLRSLASSVLILSAWKVSTVMANETSKLQPALKRLMEMAYNSLMCYP